MARLIVVLVLVFAVLGVNMGSSSSSSRKPDATVLVDAAVISCPAVNAYVVPCVQYVAGMVDKPTTVCCHGIQSVIDLAPSQPDLVAVCNCIKAELPIIGKTDPSRIASLPRTCGMPRDFPPIDANYDCSKVTDLY